MLEIYNDKLRDLTAEATETTDETPRPEIRVGTDGSVNVEEIMGQRGWLLRNVAGCLVARP